MIYIPKKILKKLKLRDEEEIIQEEKDLEETRAVENTKRFKRSMEVVDKIGKEIGEMREWAPYCSDPKIYNPFPISILDCNKQQMLQLLMHAYGTAQHLKDKEVELKEQVKAYTKHNKELIELLDNKKPLPGLLPKNEIKL